MTYAEAVNMVTQLRTIRTQIDSAIPIAESYLSFIGQVSGNSTTQSTTAHPRANGTTWQSAANGILADGQYHRVKDICVALKAQKFHVAYSSVTSWLKRQKGVEGNGRTNGFRRINFAPSPTIEQAASTSAH